MGGTRRGFPVHFSDGSAVYLSMGIFLLSVSSVVKCLIKASARFEVRLVSYGVAAELNNPLSVGLFDCVSQVKVLREICL